MLLDVHDPTELYGQAVTGSQGEKLGKVSEVYLDQSTGRVEWAAVATGIFGSHVALVPLAAADYDRRSSLQRLPTRRAGCRTRRR